MYLNKAETFELAWDLDCLNDVIELSHTCYNGDREHKHDWGYGCGECPACDLRAKGYMEWSTTSYK
jgi:7-cyano-7-deazaguanine synthase